MTAIAGWIAEHARATPDQRALLFAGRVITYAQLHRRIEQYATTLARELALAPGSRVAWFGLNSPEALALMFACARQGLVWLPLNWRLSATEIAAVLDDAGASLVIIDASCASRAGEVAGWRRLSCGFDCPGAQRMAPATAFVSAPVAPRGELRDPLLLVYTSGTTGRPKGVLLTQSALLYNALNAVHMHELVPEDVVLTVLPMFHVGGLNIQTLPALYRGATVALEPRFEPGRTLELFESLRPSLTVQVPATLKAMLDHPRWAHTDLRSLRCIATGSTDVPVPLIEAWQARGVPVIQIYGATETGPVAIYQRIAEAYSTVGAIGRAGLHTQVRLIAADGGLARVGETGEIQVRGPHVAIGYWDREAQGAQPFADGWFASGDVATLDEQGVYWFKDRIKHVIISGGENIYPAELERVLAGSPLVREAAVAGRPHPRWGEVPVVIAVADAAVGRDAVLRLFEGRLARYKHPHDVVFVEALPRNALGKVEVRKLRELARAQKL